MDSPPNIDSTEVLNMRLDFQNFVAENARNSSRKRPLQISGFAPLELDENSSFDQRPKLSSSMRSTDHITLGSLMEKDKEVKEREAQLFQAKATIAELQNRIGTIETSRKRQRIEYEHDVENVKKEATTTKDKLEEMKGQLRILVKREEEARDEVKECRQQLSSTKATLGSRVSELQKEKIELEAKLDEVDFLSRAQIMELKKEKMRQETEMEICRSERIEAQDQLITSQKRCVELKKQVQELEEYRKKALEADIKAKDLETTLSRMEDDALITKTMKSQLTRLSDLERENRKLLEENNYCKNTKENVHLLREELESAKQKLSRAEARADEAEKMRATCEALQERLQKWESCHVPGSNRPRSPAEMSRQIADLQQTSLLTLEKQGELQASESLMAQRLQITQDELKTVQEKLVAEQKKCVDNNDFIKRIQRKLLLLKKERDGYKQILDSYESEVTMTVGGGRNSPLPNRVKQLEDTLHSYRNHLAQLEKQRDDAVNAEKEANNKIMQLQFELQNSLHHQPVSTTSEVDQKIISSLREQVAEVEGELQKAVVERDTLAARIEQRHLQGDFDPTKTKVLHMTCNPTSMAQEQRARELGRLREETQGLQERLRLLEEGGGQVDDLTVKVQENLAQPSTSDELEALKASLSSAELKNKRLMEAFKKKSHEFREACFQLLGYKIDIPTDKQYRLMNIYAEGPEDFLLFQQNTDGAVQLLSNDYSSTLTEKIETYLAGANSIPAFLSSITLMLFSRQTMFQPAMASP